VAARRIELVASAQRQAGTVYGGAQSVPTATMAQVTLDITAVSGTATPTINFWLQASDDGGTTWYDLPYDLQMTTAAGATDVDANETRRNINGTAGATGTGKHLAIFKHLAADMIRPVFDITGTFAGGQGITFSADLVVK
jgi:hypothetical protein